MFNKGTHCLWIPTCCSQLGYIYKFQKFKMMNSNTHLHMKAKTTNLHAQFTSVYK